MTTIYLVRHGQKERVMGDPGLTDIGRKQAEYTAKFLQDKSVRYLYFGPLRMTRATAKIIADKLGLGMTIDARLKERMNWGDKAGESFDDFLREWNKTQKNRDYVPYHGDSSKNTGKRMQTFVEDVSQKHTGTSIVAVTSGGAIGDLLRNLYPSEQLPLLTDSISQTQYVEILECSITTLHKFPDRVKLEVIGSITHLPVPII